MVFLYITSINKVGEFQEFCVGGEKIEMMFDLLNRLVNRNCKLISAHLSDTLNRRLELPVAAFDGKPIRVTIEQLQREWEQVLC